MIFHTFPVMFLIYEPLVYYMYFKPCPGALHQDQLVCICHSSQPEWGASAYNSAHTLSAVIHETCLGGNSLLCTELKPLCGSSLLAVLEQWKILVQLQRALGQTEPGVCGVPQQPPAAPAPTSSFEMAKTRGRHPTTI